MTGAYGRIGSSVSPLLSPGWDLQLTDQAPGLGAVLDVTDLDACRAAFAGADAVIHLAGNPSPKATWEQLLAPNVVGTYVVAQAAMDCQVRRLVLASSIQAVLARPDGVQSRSTDAPRPANLYGATKAWAEAIGSWVSACSSTTVVAVRIGYFAPKPPEPWPDTDLDSHWLSPGDCADLLRAAVEAEGFSFVVVNGMSANRHLAAELTAAMGTLGYHPRDDAWKSGSGTGGPKAD